MTAHREVSVKVNTWVDEGVAGLITALSEFDGLVTIESCQGDEGRANAFVVFEYGDWRQTGEFLFGKLLPRLSPDLRSDTSLRVEAYDTSIARGHIEIHPRAIAELAKVVRDLSAVSACVPVTSHAHCKTVPKIVSAASSN